MIEKRDDRYANTPATGLFLDRSRPGYAGGFLEMANARLYGFWNNLTESPPFSASFCGAPVCRNFSLATGQRRP